MILLSNAYHCEIFRCEIFRKDTIFILIDKIYLISNIKTKYNIQCRNPYCLVLKKVDTKVNKNE